MPLSPFEWVAAIGLSTLAVIAVWVWTSAQLAVMLATGGPLPLSLSGILPVLGPLAQDPARPPSAFPATVESLVPGPVLFWSSAAFVLALVCGPALVWHRRRSRHAAEDAGSRWAAPSDLRPLVVRRPVPGRLTLGRGPRGRLLAAETGHSLLVLGPTQSGKTSGLAIPAILEWPGPVVATSVKADLLTHTIDRRRRTGQVWTYDPTDSVDGHRPSTWTPLAGCGTWRGALRTATWMSQAARDRQLGETDFWYANAAKLLAPLLFAARCADMTISDVVRWVDVQDVDEVALLLRLTGVDQAMNAATATWQRDERTRSSIYTTAETVLAAYADPTVAESAATCEIDIDRLLSGDTHTLYVSAPVHEQARLRPLFTTLVQTVLAAAYEKVASGRLDPPLLLVLDEAANIAPLRDLAQIASTASGLGIQLVTIWQDRAQIVHRYGDAAATVVNNHRAKLLLSGITDATTTADAATVIGDTHVTRRSTTVDADGRTSATETVHARPLAAASRLRLLQPFEGVLIYGHLPAVKLSLLPWFRPAGRWKHRATQRAPEPSEAARR